MGNNERNRIYHERIVLFEGSSISLVRTRIPPNQGAHIHTYTHSFTELDLTPEYGPSQILFRYTDRIPTNTRILPQPHDGDVEVARALLVGRGVL